MNELTELRSLCARIYDLGNGQMRARISLEPQCVPIDPAAWKRGERVAFDLPNTALTDTGSKLDAGPLWYGLSVSKGAVGYEYRSRFTGGTVAVELLEVDGRAITAPATISRANQLWWVDVVEGLDLYLDIRPKSVELFKRIKSEKGPRRLLWRVTESANRSIPLRHQTAGHDNADLAEPTRAQTGVGRIRRRVQMAEPVLGKETTNADGSVSYTVLEEWTGNTIALDADRIPSLSAEVVYPVLIDTVISEPIAADGDDGHQIDTAGTWENSYGATGDHIIYDPISATVQYYPGYRFTTVNIAQGATINSATLTINLKNSASGAGATATVYGRAIDDATAPSNGNGPKNWTKTTANAAFGVWGSSTTATRVITVTTIIQEIVNRAGWVANNALALLVDYTPTNNAAFSYIDDLAGGASGIATLDIDFTSGGAAATSWWLPQNDIPGAGPFRASRFPPFVQGIAPVVAPLTLAIDTPGSITFQGQSIATNLGVDLATQGSITFAGQSVGLSLGIPVVNGSITLAGQSVTFGFGVALSTQGSITFAGQAVGLSLTAPLTGGSLTFQGQSLATAFGLALAVPGSITFAGQTVALDLTGALTLAIDTAGSITLAGQDVALVNQAATTTVQPSGGWERFDYAYEREMRRRRDERRKREQLEDETDQIPQIIDREIAQLLREQEAKDAKRDELTRLKGIATDLKAEEARQVYGDRVGLALERAVLQGNYSALEALEREIERARTEEDFMLLATLLLIADD